MSDVLSVSAFIGCGLFAGLLAAIVVSDMINCGSDALGVALVVCLCALATFDFTLAVVCLRGTR